jgi:hypothetical protein
VALACARLGQLLVWDWRAETYVLKQQGHYYDVAAVAYSPDGALLASGADDSKVPSSMSRAAVYATDLFSWNASMPGTLPLLPLASTSSCSSFKAVISSGQGVVAGERVLLRDIHRSCGACYWRRMAAVWQCGAVLQPGEELATLSSRCFCILGLQRQVVMQYHQRALSACSALLLTVNLCSSRTALCGHLTWYATATSGHAPHRALCSSFAWQWTPVERYAPAVHVSCPEWRRLSASRLQD